MSQGHVFTINIDGGSRGNPGPAAYAYVIRHDGEVVLEESGYLGKTTNNVAEYTALVEALAKAIELNANQVLIRSDSELLVKQMRGEYKVKNAQLQELHQEANDLKKRFKDARFTHVPREQNKEADRLCNETLDDAARGHAVPRPSRVRTPTPASKPKAVAAPEWKGTLQDAERLLREAGHTWAESGMDAPTPHDVLQQIVELLDARGFLRH